MQHPTALVSHTACALHDTGWGHPEHQGRLPAIVKALYAETPALQEHVLQAEADAADLEDVLRVHTQGHVQRVRRAVDRADQRGEPHLLTDDTVVSADSLDAALGAAGAALHATRLVFDRESASAFVLTRPPGHHATADRAMGFCLFNNVAIAARWAQAEAGVERILIIDWDVHHGNGTQDIFYDDPSVHFLSFHLAGHYPGTGSAEEQGEGAGRGSTRNLPFARGTERGRYLDAFDTAVRETAAAFDPELVLVSAGFDCLAGDPLGGLLLEPPDLHTMTRTILDAARSTAAGRVVTLLEGGYVPARAGAGAVQVVRALAGLPSD